eukprot:Opistho-2@78054
MRVTSWGNLPVVVLQSVKPCDLLKSLFEHRPAWSTAGNMERARTLSLLLKAAVALLVLAAFAQAQCETNEIYVDVIFRDHHSGLPSSPTLRHPDFERSSYTTSTRNVVEQRLDADNKPVAVNIWNLAERSRCFISPDTFYSWYHDGPFRGGYESRRVDKTMKWVRITAGSDKFKSAATTSSDGSGFYPLNGLGYGDYASNGNNYGFTTELAIKFQYKGFESFKFTGDDDFWAFIDGYLVVDMGGLHSPESATISLPPDVPVVSNVGITQNLILRVGREYTLRIFNAERHSTGSTFYAETTLRFTPTIKIETENSDGSFLLKKQQPRTITITLSHQPDQDTDITCRAADGSATFAPLRFTKCTTVRSTTMAVTFVSVNFLGTTVTCTGSSTGIYNNILSNAVSMRSISLALPTFTTLPSNVAVPCTGIPAFQDLTATDDCRSTSVVTKTETKTPGACVGRYSLARKWVATDSCGNTASYTQTITVTDNVAPTFQTTVAPVAVPCGTTIPLPSTIQAVDNCGGTVTIAPTVETIGAGACPRNYTINRSVTATDDCGNSAVYNYFHTTYDVTVPRFPSPPTADITVTCIGVPTASSIQAQESCAGSFFTVNPTDTRLNGSCPNSYTLTRRWRAVAQCGGVATTDQRISVQDRDAPVLQNVPASVSIKCSDPVPIAQVTAIDACPGTVAVTFQETRTNSCANAYTLTRTWFAKDVCGNQSPTSTQQVQVTDNVAPVLNNVPADVSVACSAVPPVPTNITARDDCDGAPSVALAETTIAGACANRYTIQRTWTARDACGNPTSVTQRIIVTDNVAPTLVGVPANVTVTCSTVPTAPTVTATDNCGSATVTYTQTRTNGRCANAYTLLRTWSATDACGQTTTGVQKITVNDTTAPVFSSPPPTTLTAECNSIPAVPSLQATDDCNAAVNITFSSANVAGSCGQTYQIVRTWKATDECGNVATFVQTVNVQDTTRPVLNGVPANVSVACQSVPAAAAVTANDGCDLAPVVTLTQTRSNTSCTQTYTLIRTWTARDACGNSATASQSVFVQDNTSPVFSGAQFETFIFAYNNASKIPALVSKNATDNCYGNLVASGSEVRVNGSCANTYTLQRSWTATDGCSNNATVKQNIVVSDGRLPNVTGLPSPIDYSTKCSVPISVPVVVGVNGTGQAVTVTGPVVQTLSGVCSGNYTRVYTWTATDACGNSQSFQQRVIVFDTDAPVLSGVPSNVTVTCDAIPAVPVVTANDLCGSASVVFQEKRTGGACPWRYTIQRTWTATDACGNVASMTQTITVVSATTPTFSATPATTLRVACSAVPTAPSLSATARCGSATVTFAQVRTNGGCGQAFSLARTWTATDECQNTVNFTQTVTVVDETRPALVGIPTNVTVSCDRVPPENSVAVSATDDCDPAPVVTVATTRGNGACTHAYTLTRTWTARDSCGNNVTGTQVIKVQDNAGPVFTGVPADRADSCDAVALPPTVTATDVCFGAVNVTLTKEDQPGSCGGSFTRVYTWRAVDGCGNNATAQSKNIVSDTKAPTIDSAPTSTAMTCQDAWDLSGLDELGVTAQDECDANPVLISQQTSAVGGCKSNYTLTRTFVARDWCGNTATHTQVINVSDASAPQILAANLYADVNLADCDLIPYSQDVIAYDACDSSPACVDDPVSEGCLGKTYTSPTEVKSAIVCPNTYTLTRSYKVTDSCSNTARIVQRINVVDRKTPEFSTKVPADASYTCASQIDPATASQMRATDRCDASPVVTLNITQSATCANRANITRTWIATDSCGNKKTATQVVRVLDNSAPTLTGVPTAASLSCADPAVSQNASVSATDNCDANAVVKYASVKESIKCPSNYTLRRTWTATDVCNNSAKEERVVQVYDNTPPTFVNLPNDLFLPCGSSIPAAPTVTAVDDCGAVVGSVEFKEEAPVVSCKQSLSVRRTWKAVDDCGNVAFVERFVYIVDNTPPDFNVTSLPDLVSVSGMPAVPAIKATDACTANVNITYSESTANGTCANSFTMTRRWVATDECGNFNYISQKVSVGDETPPVFSGSQMVSLTCGAALPNVTVSDNVEGDIVPTLAQSRIEGACPFNYTVLRQYRASDKCGNKAGLDQYALYSDSIAPILVGVPSDVTVDCTAIPAAPVVTATDNCDSAANVKVTLEENRESIVCAGSHVLVRTWRAVDRCGNLAVGIQRVTVRDTVAPVMSNVPADADLECGTPIVDPVTAVDACSGARVQLNVTVTPGACSGNRTLLRVWTATDTCGNAATATQTIRVRDTTPPAFVSAPGEAVVRCFDPRPSSGLAANDACDGAVTTQFNETTDDTRNLTITKGCPVAFHLFRVWNATDSCGNKGIHRQNVTVMYTEYGYDDAANQNGNNGASSGASKSSGNGAVIGGAVGGALAVVLVAAALGYLYKTGRLGGNAHESSTAKMFESVPGNEANEVRYSRAESMGSKPDANGSSNQRNPSASGRPPSQAGPRSGSVLKSSAVAEAERLARQQNEIELKRTFTNLFQKDQLDELAEFNELPGQSMAALVDVSLSEA